MKKVILFLLVLCGLGFAQSDLQVAQKTITVPEHIVRPSVRYAPDYAIKMTDSIEITIKLNGNVVQGWKYKPNYAPETGNILNFILKMSIVETVEAMETPVE